MKLNIGLVLGIMEIALLDLVLCGDNIGIIALATRNLPPKSAKLAGIIGVTGAIALRIYFAICISAFLNIRWIPLRLIGGIILIKVTWDLISSTEKEEEYHGKSSQKFWDAVIAVILADVSMSLDNVLAIAGAADGNISLIVIGIFLNVPFIFFGSQFVMKLMQKIPMVVYIGGSILAFTSVKMIMEDNLFKHYIHLTHSTEILLQMAAAVAVILYGYNKVKNQKIRADVSKEKISKVS
ncbi:MAG: TerC family protein [Clostridiales bacterium]|uniref:TerC family protein n=1 Tax=Clostridium sp. N3C TaxID=1776758 RepID=UPI00092E0B87|nr:TerC family protein [Clostridium sp. N3C]NLZ48039.1 TerC family protein [Clostridiales bacterium]SCN24497.1 integral membrane protein, YjbE family [Clostridium sp. N3C]